MRSAWVMKLKPGQEILTDTRDHIVTAISADHAAARTGATVRQAQLYADPAKVSFALVATRAPSGATATVLTANGMSTAWTNSWVWRPR